MKRTTTALALALLAGASVTLGGAGLRPPPASEPKTSQPAPARKGLIDTLAADKNYSTLVAALRAADLIDALKARGPFTLMAPTNDAFAKLPAGELERLLKPENKADLQSLLKYHVIPARISSAQLLKFRESSKTLEGHTFRIAPKNGALRVGSDDQNLVNSVAGAIDIDCDNGIIHAIDGVMIPPKEPTLHRAPPEPN